MSTESKGNYIYIYICVRTFHQIPKQYSNATRILLNLSAICLCVRQLEHFKVRDANYKKIDISVDHNRADTSACNVVSLVSLSTFRNTEVRFPLKAKHWQKVSVLSIKLIEIRA
jgi:hypothetical protein